MIIIMDSNDKLAATAAEQLAAVTREEVVFYHHTLDLSKVKDTKITFIDLRADSSFQDRFDANHFADKLCKDFKISLRVNTIDFLIAENQNDDSMIAFAETCVQRLKSEHKREDIKIRTFLDPTYGNMLLTPPTGQHKKWQIHGLRNFTEANPAQRLNYQVLYASPSKELLWEGKNLEDWLNNPQRIHEATSVEVVPIPDNVPTTEAKEKTENQSPVNPSSFFHTASGKQPKDKRKQSASQSLPEKAKLAKREQSNYHKSPIAINTGPKTNGL